MAKREDVFNLTKGKCFYCGCDLDINNYHIDHFIPKVKGGKCGKNNVPSCIDCNIMKSNLTIEEFREIIYNLLNSSIQGRLISKYYTPKKNDFKFYFEDLEVNT